MGTPDPAPGDPPATWPGRWWHALDDGRIQCDLCPRECRLHEGQRGLCFVRAREGDAIVSTTYGRSSGYCVDPIEKKPLNHFLPGSSVLSFGTAGCNLTCKFCQNWDISKSRDLDTLADTAMPAGHRPRRRAPGLRERGVHLQRSGDLRRVRDRHGRRVPGAWDPHCGGERGLHQPRAACRVLSPHGRGQHRPQGLHRGLLPPYLRCRAGRRARDDRVRRHPDRHVVGAHDTGDPRAQRLRVGAGRDDPLGRGALRTRRPHALQCVPPGLEDA